MSLQLLCRFNYYVASITMLLQLLCHFNGHFLILLLDFKFYVVLFDNFEIDIHFQIISKLFFELTFPNFFPNFLAKILRVWKFHFFLKNFQTSIAELFRNSRKQKVRNIPSNAGPYFKFHFYIQDLIKLQILSYLKLLKRDEFSFKT